MKFSHNYESIYNNQVLRSEIRLMLIVDELVRLGNRFEMVNFRARVRDS